MRGINYPFFRFLVDKGFVDVQTLERILQTKDDKREGCDVVKILERLELDFGVSQVDVMKQLSDWVGVEFEEKIDARIKMCDVELVTDESYEAAPSECCIQLRYEDKLWLFLVDPWSQWKNGLPGKECKVRITTTHEIKKCTHLLSANKIRDANIEKKDDVLASDKGCEEKNDTLSSYVDCYLNRAIQIGASDVHFESMDEGMRIRYRVDGDLIEEEELLSKRIMNVAVNQLKIIGGMSVAEKRIPQEGLGTYEIEGRERAFRFACMPTIKGEGIVMRCMRDFNERMCLEKLGLGAKDCSRVLKALRSAQGLMLVVGPTGSGKTTTLYAMLQQLCQMNKKIVSIEDPIEMMIPGVNQVQVDERNGINFESALKSFLRQAPEVIMIGEIRDQETARIAVQAACTGHLVLGTLHTEDSLGAIVRLIDLSVNAQSLSNVLKLVIAQRLVRVGIESSFHGRSGVFEILEMNDDLKQAIRKNASIDQLRLIVNEYGFINLWQVGLKKVRLGMTTTEELRRCMPQWRMK